MLTCHPTDRVEILDLTATADESFSKVMAVLATLCDEVSFLKVHAAQHFYAQISLFGHSKEDDGMDYSEGVLEAMMGRSLDMFQDCANFCTRCNNLAVHFMQQTSAIYGKVGAAVAALL